MGTLAVVVGWLLLGFTGSPRAYEFERAETLRVWGVVYSPAEKWACIVLLGACGPAAWLIVALQSWFGPA